MTVRTSEFAKKLVIVAVSVAVVSGCTVAQMAVESSREAAKDVRLSLTSEYDKDLFPDTRRLRCSYVVSNKVAGFR